jgi:hypothetical protein
MATAAKSGAAQPVNGAAGTCAQFDIAVHLHRTVTQRQRRRSGASIAGTVTTAKAASAHRIDRTG